MRADTVRERQALNQVTDRLTQTFADRYSPAQVNEAITAAHHRFDGRPIREFVPVLVERIARRELTTHAWSSHAPGRSGQFTG